MREKNRSNKPTKGTGLFYAWKLGERAFNIQIIMTVIIFIYCWRWLNINFFLSILIGICIAFILVLFLDASIFRVLARRAKRKGKD